MVHDLMNLRFVAIMIVVGCVAMVTSPVRVNVHARVDVMVPLGVVLVGRLAMVAVRMRVAIIVVGIVGSVARWKIPIFDGTVICVNSMMVMMNITICKMMTIAELMSITKSMVADAKTIIIRMVVAMGSVHDVVSLCTVTHHVVEALPVVAAPAISVVSVRRDEVIGVRLTLGIAVDSVRGLEKALGKLIVIPKLLGGQGYGGSRRGGHRAANCRDGLDDIIDGGHDFSWGDLFTGLFQSQERLHDLCLKGLHVHGVVGVDVVSLSFRVRGLLALVVHPGALLLLLEHLLVEEVAADLVRGRVVVLEVAVIFVLFEELSLGASNDGCKGERLEHD